MISIGVRGTLKNWLGQIFFYPRDTIVSVEGNYDEYWDRKRGTRTKLFSWQKARADIIVESILGHGLRTPTIADIGAGDGAILANCIARMSGATGTAYDSSDRALEFARTAGIQHAVSFDLNKDPMLEGVTDHDYVLLLEILEHVPQSEKVLAAARSKARKSVYVSFPNSGFFTYRLRLLFGKFPAQWTREPNEHVRFWTLSDVRWWLKAQDITGATVRAYQGVPVLNRIAPSLFAAGIIIEIPSSR